MNTRGIVVVAWLVVGHAILGLLYWRTMMHFRVHRFWHRMPILVAFGLVTFFIWVAENLGTWSRAWLYPSQADGWRMVGIEKFGSWYLLMTISVVLVTLVHRPATIDSAATEANVRADANALKDP